MTFCELAFLRNHSELFLSREGLFAELVPTLIEFAFVFVSPLLRNVVRCMGCPGREVHKKGLVCGQQSLLTHSVDRAVGHIGHEMVPFCRCGRGIDDLRAFVNRGIPLIGLACDKSVKVFES